MIKKTIFVISILLALGASFVSGVRYGNYFYEWLFYEPYKREYEAHRQCKKELKAIKIEIKAQNDKKCLAR